MDINIGLAVIVITLQIITTLVSVTGFLMVKFNDLKHLSSDVKELRADLKEDIEKLQEDSDTKHKENKGNIKELSKLIAKIATLQAERIGICETRHKS
jgi:ribosomal protein L29